MTAKNELWRYPECSQFVEMTQSSKYAQTGGLCQREKHQTEEIKYGFQKDDENFFAE